MLRSANMKNILVIILILISISLFGQKWNNVKGKPKDLVEAFHYLDKMFDDTTKFTYMTLPSDVVSGKLYCFGLGLWIRNNWGLWGNSDLKKYFIENGVTHPDHSSGIILSEYYNYLNHKPFGIKHEVDSSLHKMTDQERGKYIESKMTKPEELLRFFPINDTIVVYISVTEKNIFKKEEKSARTLAKVIKHENDELIVDLLKIPLCKKQTTEYKIGQEIKVNPYWCELIPPRKWKWE